MKIIKKNYKVAEFIRFAMVGFFATGIHYGIYLGLQASGVKYNIAYTLGYGISFIFNFVASNYFTFKTNPTVKNGARFAGAHIINYFLQMTLLNLFIYMKIPNNIAPIFVFAISIPVNFILVRFSLKKALKK
ncbi:GtrA family protein [Clostridium algidicarnis]|uniref:GtrA family protein n=1 Tax=Clostridium algidicarnis TaxID=37659 RepID=UPI001C0AD034|nr:GtrA family protein [Clostridium algidicarnis]MBU3193125.1 GtrA family protein [Clostridium algidicarnis]MCB2286359.1 GtrA family protein [Clostridium algidicarnis]